MSFLLSTVCGSVSSDDIGWGLYVPPSFFITEMLLTNQVVLGNEKPECYHSPYYEGFIKSLTKH